MVGHNSRECYQGANYDIQTQDLEDRKLIETRIYREGKILATVRNTYADVHAGPVLEQMVSRQHEETCAKVREGSYALIFLWISRGIIAYESGDLQQALEYFESVLSIDESQEEVQCYLDRIRTMLAGDAKKRKEIASRYRDQIASLNQSRRRLEASRKEAILSRIAPMGRSPASAKEPLISQAHGFLLSVMRRFPSPTPQFRRSALVSTACMLLILCSGVIFTDAQIRLDPDFYSYLGRTYLEKDRTLLARSIFYNLLCQDPKSEETFVQLWETFHRKGDYEVAADILGDFLDAGVPPARAHFYLAEAYRLGSRCPEALDRYASAMKAGWPEEDCKIGMGLCLLDQNDPSASIRLWEEMIELGSRDFRVEYALGMAYQASGRPGRASFYFTKALHKHPSPSVYRSLATCLQEMHQDEEAQKLLEKADLLDAPNVPESPCPTTRHEVLSPSHQNTEISIAACFPFPLP